jgi:hypothetical protein
MALDPIRDPRGGLAQEVQAAGIVIACASNQPRQVLRPTIGVRLDEQPQGLQYLLANRIQAVVACGSTASFIRHDQASRIH